MQALRSVLLFGCFTLLSGAFADSTNVPPAAAKSGATAEAAWEALGVQVEAVKAAEDRETRGALDRKLVASIDEFIKTYLGDSHVLNARMLWAQTANEMGQLGLPDAPSASEVEKTFDELAEDPKVPLNKRAEIRLAQIQDELDRDSDAPTTTPAAWKSVDDRIAAFEKKFGADFSLDGQSPVIVQLRKVEMITRKAANDPGVDDLLERLARDSVPAVAEMAKGELAKEKLVAALKVKPLDLKFTSVDGRPVDLASFRGKVVLIDFWATWCGPCREEMPNVVAAYAKLHGQGFEILGISLDEDKDKLVAFTQANQMPWPQYFDGKMWDNTISSKYGIESIPDMWLLGKDGLLKTTAVQKDVAAQVEALLKE